MSHGHTIIDSKGICIYCGKAGVRLTDEHIVPLSLGGQHVIGEASCHDCAKVTSKFERDVAREFGEMLERVIMHLLAAKRSVPNIE